MNRSFHSDDAKTTLTRDVVVSEQGLHLPGSDSPGPSALTERDNAHTSASARDSLFIDSPESETRAGGKPPQSTMRGEFARLFNARCFPEARRLAELMLAVGLERVAWVNNLANVAREQGALREAYSLYVSHAHLLETCEDEEVIAKFCNVFAMTSQELGTLHGVCEYHDRALYYYRLASEHYELAGKPEKQAYTLVNTGWLLVAIGYPERSFEYLDRAEALFTEPGRLAGVLIVRALAFEAQNDLANALECLSDAINLLDPIKDVEAKSYDETRKILRRVAEKV